MRWETEGGDTDPSADHPLSWVPGRDHCPCQIPGRPPRNPDPRGVPRGPGRTVSGGPELPTVRPEDAGPAPLSENRAQPHIAPVERCPGTGHRPGGGDTELSTDLGTELRGAGDEQRQQKEERAGAAGPHLAGPDLCLGGNKAVRLLPTQCVQPSGSERQECSRPPRRGGDGKGAQSDRCAAWGACGHQRPRSGGAEWGGGAGPRAWEKEGPPG